MNTPHDRFRQHRVAQAQAERERERAATTPDDVELARRVLALDAAGHGIAARRLINANPTSYTRGAAALRDATNTPPEAA